MWTENSGNDAGSEIEADRTWTQRVAASCRKHMYRAQSELRKQPLLALEIPLVLLNLWSAMMAVVLLFLYGHSIAMVLVLLYSLCVSVLLLLSSMKWLSFPIRALHWDTLSWFGRTVLLLINCSLMSLFGVPGYVFACCASIYCILLFIFGIRYPAHVACFDEVASVKSHLQPFITSTEPCEWRCAIDTLTGKCLYYDLEKGICCQFREAA